MSNLKVMIVDDETDFVTALTERLQLRGIEAVPATDGETALRMIESDPPQVVVLDLKMPGMDGFEVLKRIKSQYPGIPVLLLTGHGSANSGEQGMGLGAYDYLMKPLNIHDLIKKIQEAYAAFQT